MFNILEKLLVFILEGAKATPEEGVEDAPVAGKRKPMVAVAVAILLGIAGAIAWYDNYYKANKEIVKLKESNYQKTIADLQRANSTLKEERIRLTAKVDNINRELTDAKRTLNELKHEYDVATGELSDEREIITRQKTAIDSQRRHIESLQLQLDTYAKDNRIIWDKMVTLGQEEGS